MRSNLLRASALGFAASIATAGLSPAAAQTANTTIILTNGSTVTQDFNSLPATGTATNASLTGGLVFFETGANANQVLTAGTGSLNTGDTYSFGAAGSSDRALGSLLSGSLVPSFGIAFTNQTGLTINALQIAFTGEQFRLGATGRADVLDFNLGIGTRSLTAGTFQNFGSTLDFSSPITTGTVGQVSGSTFLSATISGFSILNGQDFLLRFTDVDVTGADDGLAVDNLSLTPSFLASAIPEPQTWATMLAGFGLVGAAMRRRSRRAPQLV